MLLNVTSVDDYLCSIYKKFNTFKFNSNSNKYKLSTLGYIIKDSRLLLIL